MQSHPNRYIGPPLGDPRAKTIGTYTGSLAAQPPDFQAAVASVLAGYGALESGYVPFPIEIEITLDEGHKLRSTLVSTSLAVVRQWRAVRLFVSKWNGNRLEWALVQIKGDVISIELKRNPADIAHAWRRDDPSIVHAP